MQILTYIKNANQENYHELFNQTMQNGLGNNGWTVPQQNTANITVLASVMPLGTIWYNMDINKLQVLTATGVQTITSA
jgi:uncharacterized lipoprotein YajG